jgi:hypothetical protein
MSWILVVFIGSANLSVSGTAVSSFKSEAACTAAAALTVSEITTMKNVREVGFLCLEQK